MRTKFYDLVGWLLRRYLRSPTAMLVLRRHPRLAWVRGSKGWIKLVVGHREAVRVLREDRGFGVPYLPKMLALDAPFALGLQRSANHTRQRRAIGLALDDEAALEALADASRRAAAQALDGRTRIEVIGELTDVVVAKTTGAYLGTGELKREDLDRARAVFRQIFINPFDLPEVEREGEAAAKVLRRVVDAQVEVRRGASVDCFDVLGRLLSPAPHAPRLIGEEANVQMVGLLVAWVASVPRAMAYALDWLLDHPDAMARGYTAAEADDVDAMWAVLLEALQSRPPAPAVERRCERAGRIASENVMCERDVMVVLTSAMQDPAFDTATADDALLHLPFGYGLHQCLGRGVSKYQMSAIAIELLRRPDVGRVCPLKLDGPYPCRLDVSFGAPL